MTFSPGQNGKGAEKIKQNGKVKSNCFCKKKGKTKDKLQASFFKERLIAQPNALRKIDAELHHHAVRSPQKRAKPNNFTQIAVVEEIDLPRVVFPGCRTICGTFSCCGTPRIAECKTQELW